MHAGNNFVIFLPQILFFFLSAFENVEDINDFSRERLLNNVGGIEYTFQFLVGFAEFFVKGI
jgi:hypothetical protein